MALRFADELFIVGGDDELAYVSSRIATDWHIISRAVLDDVRASPSFHIEGVVYDAEAVPEVLADCPKMHNGALLLAEHAIAALEPMLSGAGYFINVNLDAPMRYRLFVCDRIIDALDQERSEIKRFADGDIWEVYRPEFHHERLAGADVFKVAGIRGDLFVSDRFKAAVEQHGFLGFEFRKVWDSATGGIRYDPSEHWFQRSLTEKERMAAKRRAARALLAARGT